LRPPGLLGFSLREEISSTVSFPLPKNKFQTNFWKERACRYFVFFSYCQTSILIKSMSLLFICFSHSVSRFLQKRSSHFLLPFLYIFCWYLSLMPDRQHINLQPAVTIISINFPSYRTPHTSSVFHSENQIDEINEMKRTDRLFKFLWRHIALSPLPLLFLCIPPL
jgi:hypothetical protein